MALTCLHFESLPLAKSKDKINLYLSFRNFGTPKYPESRNYARQALYVIFTSLHYGFRILDFGSRRKWREPRGTKRSCIAFHTISGVIRMQQHISGFWISDFRITSEMM